MSDCRVAAACFPQLLVELSAAGLHRDAPVAVVWEAQRTQRTRSDVELPWQQADRPDPAHHAAHNTAHNKDVAPHARIIQVSRPAWELGVRPGMTVASARHHAPGLLVRVMTEARVKQALTSLAEGCLELSPRVAVEMPDALLMDASGLGALYPDEGAWMEAVAQRLLLLGHAGTLCVAGGPEVALGVARWGQKDRVSVEKGRQLEALLPLPVDVLGVLPQTRQLLVEAGLRRVADVARQPRAALARRMGPCSARLRLLDVDVDPGADARPLHGVVPPERLMARLDLSDHPEESQDALLFWLKRLVDPLCTRMRMRELAALELDLTFFHGRGLRPTPLLLPLALPLWNPADILGAFRPLLERTQLPAPVQGLFLQIPRTTNRPPVQTGHLAQDSLASDAPRVLTEKELHRPGKEDVMARLWAELVGEVGKERVGVLGLQHNHAPEHATWLYAPGQAMPVMGRRKQKPRAQPPSMAVPERQSAWYPSSPSDVPGTVRNRMTPGGSQVRLPSRALRGTSPTRVLPGPVTLPGWPRPGQPLGPGLGVVVQVLPARRLWGHWWKADPLKRDYFEVVLQGGEVGWLYLEPHTGRVELQGWLD